MNYAIIVDNGGGPNLIYHDIEGEVYTFPTQYRQLLLPGTKVIYYRSEKQDDQPKGLKRLLDEAHYFAIATVGNVEPTSEGNLRATIENFERFKYGVPFRKYDGAHWETASGKFWRNGVRATDQNVYDDIVAASKTPHISAPEAPRGIGVRSTTVLTTGVESAPFAQNKLRIVTARDGYYLESLSDGIYYHIVDKTFRDYREGLLKVLCAVSGKTYLLRHLSSTKIIEIGTIEIVEHGVVFNSSFDKQSRVIKVML